MNILVPLSLFSRLEVNSVILDVFDVWHAVLLVMCKLIRFLSIDCFSIVCLSGAEDIYQNGSVDRETDISTILLLLLGEVGCTAGSLVVAEPSLANYLT
jgi:hypothetical protein